MGFNFIRGLGTREEVQCDRNRIALRFNSSNGVNAAEQPFESIDVRENLHNISFICPRTVS